VSLKLTNCSFTISLFIYSTTNFRRLLPSPSSGTKTDLAFTCGLYAVHAVLLCVMATCNLVFGYQCFEQSYCFHLQDRHQFLRILALTKTHCPTPQRRWRHPISTTGMEKSSPPSGLLSTTSLHCEKWLYMEVVDWWLEFINLLKPSGYFTYDQV
jgi:hypothetical protein